MGSICMSHASQTPMHLEKKVETNILEKKKVLLTLVIGTFHVRTRSIQLALTSKDNEEILQSCYSQRRSIDWSLQYFPQKCADSECNKTEDPLSLLSTEKDEKRHMTENKYF